MHRSPRVYLDHNATSPVRPEAARKVREVLEGTAANPSSLHAEGREARAFLEEARFRVASLAGLAPNEVVFTSGGSEGIAAAIRGVCETAPRGRRRILVSGIEHSAVLQGAALAARSGFLVEEVPCGADGRVHAGEFEARLRSGDVALAALQSANNETGVVQPVAEVGAACAASEVPFLVDAVQSAGKLPLDAEVGAADLVVLSGHKVGGPQGTGFLGVRGGRTLVPLIPGGAQERRRRGGTEAVASLAGFGVAAECARLRLGDESARLGRLRARIEEGLRERFPEVRIHGEGAPRLPNTVSFGLPGVPGEPLVIALDLKGIAVSTGSACASGAVEPSHVLRAMGLGEEEARQGVRVSLGWSTSSADVERFLETLPDLVDRVRRSGI